MKIFTILGGSPVAIEFTHTAEGRNQYTITNFAGEQHVFYGSGSSNGDEIRQMGWACASDAELGLNQTIEDYAEATGWELETDEQRAETQASWESCKEDAAAFARLGLDPVNGKCSHEFILLE